MGSLVFSCALLLGAPAEWEATTGLGGLVWELPPEQAPGLESSNSVAWAHRRQWHRDWWIGASALYSAYDGSEPGFVGPAFWLADAMLYRRFDLGDWVLSLGAGVAVSVFRTERILEDGVGTTPAGRYTLWMPGVHAGIHAALLRRLHPRLLAGVSLRYYSGLNWRSCWEGPARDCDGVDHETQHWVFGLSVVLVDP